MRESSVEPLFRPFVKSSETPALGIWSWTNKNIADVGVDELLQTFNHLLKKKICLWTTKLHVGDRLTVNEGSKLSLLLWQAVSEYGFALFVFPLVRVVVTASVSIMQILFKAIGHIRLSGSYIIFRAVNTRPIHAFDTLFPSLFTLGDVHAHAWHKQMKNSNY